jgi:hypothetical protein
MGNPECIQGHTGDCGGCSVLEIANNILHRHGPERDPQTINAVAERVQAEYCPEPGRMQRKKLTPPSPSAW